MNKQAILEILEKKDEELDIELLSDNEVEKEFEKRKNNIYMCSNIGFTDGGAGACCCAQVDEACIGGGTNPDGTCIVPNPDGCFLG